MTTGQASALGHALVLIQALLFAIVLALPAQARIYKWTDASGKTHYTQTAPPAESAKNLTTMETQAGGKTSAQRSLADEVDEEYCDAVQKFSNQVAQAMRRGVSAGQVRSATVPDDNKTKEALRDRASILNEIINYIFGFEHSRTPTATISGFAYRRCMEGGFQSRTKRAVAGKTAGTGWPVAGGFVVTCRHVVSGRRRVSVKRYDGEALLGTVVSTDDDNDLALIQVDKPAHLPPALPLAPREARLGQEVFTIGFPHPGVMGKKPKLTTGHISATTGVQDDPRAYQTSVPLQAGNSGGPLINMNGEVVGVVTAKLSAIKMLRTTGDLPQNVNYAVKIRYLRDLLSKREGSDTLMELPVGPRPLETLAAQVEASIVMVTAQ